MGRPGRFIACLALIVAACGTSGTESSITTTSTTTTAPAPSTTTTTEPAPTTTTTDPDTPVELELQGFSSDPFVLNSGRLHFHTVGAVPIEIQFEKEGWELRFIGERIIGFINERGDDALVEALVMAVPESLDEIRANFDSFTGFAPMTEPIETRFGGQAAMTFDAEIPVNEERFRSDCAGPSLGEERGVDRAGTGPVSGEGVLVAGPVGCSWNRVWVVPLVDGSIVALLGDPTHKLSERDNRSAPTRPIEPLLPYFEEFVTAITLDI